MLQAPWLSEIVCHTVCVAQIMPSEKNVVQALTVSSLYYKRETIFIKVICQANCLNVRI